MSLSRKYSLAAIVLSALIGSQVSAHNHAGEKPSKDPVDVVAMTLPAIVSGLKTGQFSSQGLTRAYLHRIEKTKLDAQRYARVKNASLLSQTPHTDAQ